MSDVVDLCDAIEDALGEAPPEARRILAREIDGFWEAFPRMHQWVMSGFAPSFIYHVMSSIEMACRKDFKAKPKPDLRVVEFKKM
jgi:hypothetical protein